MLLASVACVRDYNEVDLSDPGITARVKATIKSEHALVGSVRFLEINTHAGIVTLSGIADSLEQKRTLARLTQRVKGVRQVIANVIVQD